MFLPHFDVLCYLLLDRFMATWNLFVLYNKELNFVLIKAALFGAFSILTNTEKAIWRHLWSIQNVAIPLVAMRWQRIVIGLCKSRRCQTWLECRFSWNENSQRRKNWTAKYTNLKENAGNVETVFVIRSPNKPKSLDVALNIAGVEKYARKTIAVNVEAIRFEFWTERSVSDGGKVCFLWSVILKSVWNSAGDTFKLRCSWLWAVVSCTLLAAVPWNGLEHSHRKARLCVYLILRSDVLIFCIPNINQRVKNLVEFIKRINLINVLFIGFVKQWFSAYQDQFGVWFSLA